MEVSRRNTLAFGGGERYLEIGSQEDLAMSRVRSVIPALFLSAAALLSAGCASRGPGEFERIGPGEVVEFGDEAYKLLGVQEDFVLLRYRQRGEVPGGITGFVDEVFRVTRYDLGEGRWYAHEKAPGVCFQWMGFDSFALAEHRELPKGAVVYMLR
jgi:hypothetical protein